MKKRPAKILGFEIVGGLPCYRIAVVRHREQLIFRCPFCFEIHYHGVGDGHRVSHCLTKNLLNESGYFIEEQPLENMDFAGELKASIVDKLLKQLSRKKTEEWNKAYRVF